MPLLSKYLIRVDYAIGSILGVGDTAVKRISNICSVCLTFLLRISLFLALTLAFISCLQPPAPGIYPSQEHQSCLSEGKTVDYVTSCIQMSLTSFVNAKLAGLVHS